MADIDSTPLEEWRAIPGFPDYEASSFGRIRSIERSKPVLNRWGTSPPRKLKSRVLKFRLHTGGYLRVTAGHGNDLFVHRAVAMAFHGLPPTQDHQAAHLNGDKKDNRPENLVWATPMENSAHKIVHGTSAKGEKNGTSKLKEHQVLDILIRYAHGEPAHSLSSEFNVSRGLIVSIVRGRIWNHLKSEFRDVARLRAAQNIADARNAYNASRKIMVGANGK